MDGFLNISASTLSTSARTDPSGLVSWCSNTLSSNLQWYIQVSEGSSSKTYPVSQFSHHNHYPQYIIIPIIITDLSVSNSFSRSPVQNHHTPHSCHNDYHLPHCIITIIFNSLILPSFLIYHSLLYCNPSHCYDYLVCNNDSNINLGWYLDLSAWFKDKILFEKKRYDYKQTAVCSK